MNNLHLIRGARIEQQIERLDEDSTYPGLYREIQRGFPRTTRRQHALGDVTVTRMQYVPTGAGLMVNINARSHGHPYQAAIFFPEITYAQPNTGVTFRDGSGVSKSIEPIDLTLVAVKVRCSCLDFYYRFATNDFNDNSLLGPKPPPYTPVPGSTRPSVNPQHVPGVCYHLVKAVEQLQRLGLVK